MARLLKGIYRVPAIYINNMPMMIFAEIEKPILKFM
jgi:hypothetical protein